MEHKNDGTFSTGSAHCTPMTEDQRKLLALEFTKCQLMEANRPLFDSDVIHRRNKQVGGVIFDEKQPIEVICPVGLRGNDAYDASRCLPFMSEYALQLYHNVFLHTYIVCNHLKEEMMMRRKEETRHMLMHLSSNLLIVASLVTEKIKMQSSMLEEQTFKLKETMALVIEQSELLNEQRNALKEQLLEFNRLRKLRNASALTIERMTNQTARFSEEHAEKMKEQQHDLKMVFQTLEKEAAAAVETIQKQTAFSIAKQAENIKEQKRNMEQIQEVSFFY